jgi:chromosome partitioning protein
MERIVVHSAKGGVGKSVSSLSIASILASLGDRVLLIDTDPQFASTKHFAFEAPGYDWDKTIRQVLLREVKLEDVLVSPFENLHIAPAQLKLQFAESELANEPNPVFLIHEMLEEVEDRFDYCVIDTQPNVGVLTQMALTAADRVLLPTLTEAWPIEALEISFQNLEKISLAQKYLGKKIKKTLILPTFYEERRQLSAAFHFSLKQGYTDYLSENVIHRSAEIAKTYSTPMARLDEGSRPYEEYLAVINELLQGED